ncbi:peptidyl-prolyl cis-trans isomerase [Paenibacillus sp. DMB20]|uniref:peptidylprolyl isomerase n=1 Tax=Paenibacillus sp. DMB20 TaxID=1642570 RepID=UPI0006274BB3|nr:peptidylprolyl isomerase [Paenibacillus sp. DMB20]KKO53103.1 hypothetical protein XI25_15575 [Paenibacillus sp. DMB20]
MKKIKVEQILMKEHGILQDISYKTFLKKLASENNDRQRKLRNDQPIYGPREYEAEEFYSYTHSMNLQHFIDTLAKEKGKLLTDAELKPFYERVKSDYFHQGYVFEYEKIRITKGIDASNRLKSLQKYVLTENMGVQEAIGRLKHAQGIEYQRETLDLDVKSKDDAAAYNLQKMLMSMRPGDFTDMAQDDDGVIMYRLLEAKSKGYAPYDQVKSALVQIYMEQQLEQQMDERLRETQIRMNQEVLEQISFS